MTKYEEYYNKMLEDNADVFEAFRKVHDDYQSEKTPQEEYNEAGKPVIEIIRDYEDRLCNRSEGSGYASYSGNLAEKFWGRIRSDFPMIDRVGVIIKQVPVAEVETVDEDGNVEDFEIKQIEMFEIKKINL
jgi:hypothetical protein